MNSSFSIMSPCQTERAPYHAGPWPPVPKSLNGGALVLPFLLLGAKILVAGLAGFADLLERGLPFFARAVAERLDERIGGGCQVVRVSLEAVPLLPNCGER